MRIAAIDLGTNTFNLLVADADKHSFHEIFRDKRPVKIGQAGILKNHIHPDAIKRAEDVIGEYYRLIEPLGVDKTIAVATSAVRSAENGLSFVNKLKNQFGLDVKIIDGDEEAELIYYGIRSAVPLQEYPVLMLDIGGGSNEFVIAGEHGILWKQSFPLGIARLLEMFGPSDPLTLQQSETIRAYIAKALSSLHVAMERFHPEILVGSSGSFDTLASVCSYITESGQVNSAMPYSVFDTMLVWNLCKKLIYSNHTERTNIRGMDLMRIEMIPLACLFIDYVLESYDFKTIIRSGYAIKEGIIMKFIENEM